MSEHRIPIRGIPFLLMLVLSAGMVQAEDVRWTQQTNVRGSTAVIEKSGGCDGCADAGAVSEQEISSGDGYVAFRVGDTGELLLAGLSQDRRGDIDIDDIDYAIRVQEGRAEVREDNVYQADVAVNDGDSFRIAIESGRVNYYHNGEVFFRSESNPSYPLGFEVALLGEDAALRDAALVDRGGSANRRAGQDFWSDVVNARAQGQSLVKTGGCDGCADAGARSREAVQGGDVAVEFTVPDVDQTLYVGASNDSQGTGYQGIDYAIRIQDGRAEVREGNTYQADTEIRDGTDFRIEVEEDGVRYYVNDRLWHETGTRPDYPLRLDVSLLSEGAAVENVSTSRQR